MTMMFVILALAAGNDQVALTCHGGGGARKADSTSVYGGNSNGQSAWANVQGHRTEAFEDQVDVRIDRADSRIRLPRVMLPPIHGGEGGWFKLKNVEMGDDVITASASVNPINSPKIHIDRHSGVITIDGKAGHYTGECERFDPVTQPKRF